MADEIWYRLAPRVHAEVMADRALVISFESGKYFTIRDAGAKIIQGLTGGVVSEQATISSWSKTDAGMIALFFRELTEHGIIVPVAPAPSGPDLPAYVYVSEPDPLVGFTPMEVEDHLADLLKLDPIHEIGDDGWPAR